MPPFKRYIYTREQIGKKFRGLKPVISRDGLWAPNATSCAVGVFAGIFSAFIPVPLHTVIAIILARMFRGYMPFAIAFIWVCNPMTLLPIVYADYRVGCFILHQKQMSGISWNEHQLLLDLSALWQPLFAGSILLGLVLQR